MSELVGTVLRLWHFQIPEKGSVLKCDFTQVTIQRSRHMENWTKDVSLLVEPLRRLALKSDVGPVRSVLAEAVGELSEIEYDNWNGGTTTYSLTLRLPDAAYLEIQDNLEDCEKQILKRVKSLLRAETNDFVEQVFDPTDLGWPSPRHIR